MGGLIAAAIIGFVGTIITAGVQSDIAYSNAVAQDKMNKENIAAQNAMNEMNWKKSQEATEAQWARDDTAHQREVADLQAAGLSPLASLNGNASTPAIVTPGVYNPQRAPQFDASFMNSLFNNFSNNFSSLGSSFDELLYKKAHWEDEKKFKNTEFLFTAEDLANDSKRISNDTQRVLNEAKQIAINDTEVTALVEKINKEIEKIDADIDLGVKNYDLAYSSFLETKNHNMEEEALRKTAQRSEQIWNNIKTQLPDWATNYKAYYDPNEYAQALRDAKLTIYHATNSVFGGDFFGKSKTVDSESVSIGGTVLGTGSSVTSSTHRSIAGKLEAKWQQEIADFEYPVFVTKEDYDDFFDEHGKYKSK